MAEWAVAFVVAIICFFNAACYVIVSSPRGTALLVVLNRREHAQKEARPQTWFAWDFIDASDLYAAPAVGTGLLCCFRALQAAVFLFVTIYGNILYTPPGGAFFLYFTNWTFVLFGLTGLAGAGLTLKAWRDACRPAIPCIEPSQPEGVAPGWKAAHKTYNLLFETACSASIMLTIFYWFADYVPGSDIRLDNPFKHGVSAALLLLDLALSRMPLVSYHLQVSIAYGSSYLVFLWLYYIGSGHWVYRALNWSKPLAPVYYAALPLLLVLAFCVMFLIAAAREALLQRTFRGSWCCCFCGCASSDSSNADEDLLHAVTTPDGDPCTGKAAAAVAAAAVHGCHKASSGRLELQTVTSSRSSGRSNGPPSPTVAILMR